MIRRLQAWTRGRADLLALVVIMFAMFGVSIFWAGHVASEQSHQWCATLTTLDKADRNAPPPQSEFGRQLVTDFRQLRSRFGCD